MISVIYGSGQVEVKNCLLENLNNAKEIMWIGAHPNDELYLGGTLGYATRDLGIHLTLSRLIQIQIFLRQIKNLQNFLERQII